MLANIFLATQYVGKTYELKVKDDVIADLNQTLSQKSIKLAELEKDLSQKGARISDLEGNITKLNNLLSHNNYKFKKMKEYYEYLIDYDDDVGAISEVANIYSNNIDSDYGTCMKYVDKISELYDKFEEYDQKRLEYLNYISNGKKGCNDSIAIYSSLIQKAPDYREDFLVKFEKWCYGYHMVSWYEYWDEDYYVPLSNADSALSEKENEVEDAFLQAQVSCIYD